MNWKQLRLYLLITTCGGVCAALLKLAIAPAIDSSQAFVFPHSVPLATGTLIAQQPLATQSPAQVAGHQYHYQVGDRTLKIEMRYLANTDGDVATYLLSTLQPQAPLPALTIRHRSGIGYYGLIMHNQQAYLSTCINPRGETSVTREQFAHHRHIYDLRSDRLLLWLLGQADLRDWRCWWVYLSTPVGKTSPETAYQILEKTWVAWYPNWRSRVPPL